MNCTFCNNELILTAISTENIDYDDIFEYYCDCCPVSVSFFINKNFKNNEIASCTLYSNEWRIPFYQLDLDYVYSKSTLIYIDRNYKASTIFSIDSILNITPYNFNKKLKLYIPLI